MAVVMEIQVVVQMMVRVVMDEEMKKTRKLKFYTEVKRSDSMSCQVMISGDVFPVDIFLLQMVFIKSKSIRCCDVRVSRAHCWNSESIRHSTNTNAAHHSLLTFSFLFSLFSFHRFIGFTWSQPRVWLFLLSGQHIFLPTLRKLEFSVQ